MIQVITPDNEARYRDQMDQAFRLRHRTFFEEQGWDGPADPAACALDEFDDKHAVHMLYVDEGKVFGYRRLLPTTRPHVLSDILPELCIEEPPVAVRRRVSLILNIWNMVWTNALARGVEPPQQNDKVFLQSARRMEERLQSLTEQGGHGRFAMKCGVNCYERAHASRLLSEGIWVLSIAAGLVALRANLACAGANEIMAKQGAKF